MNKNNQIFAVGGAEETRTYWSNFLQDTDLLIFMVDASDVTKLSLAVSTLKELLGDQRMDNVPILVVANKQVSNILGQHLKWKIFSLILHFDARYSILWRSIVNNDEKWGMKVTKCANCDYKVKLPHSINEKLVNYWDFGVKMTFRMYKVLWNRSRWKTLWTFEAFRHTSTRSKW